MSDNDQGQFFRSAKAENDRRAERGLPLDGNYDRHNRADDQPRSGGGGGELLGCIGQLLAVVAVIAIVLIVRAVIVAAIVGFVGVIAILKWLTSGRH